MNTEQVVEDSQAGTRPTPSADEVESMYLYIDLLRKQLAKAQSQSEKSSEALHSDDGGGVDFKAVASLEKERDRYRATVLSLAFQNKQLAEELRLSRQGTSGKEERYLDTRLQVQDLKEALALKEMEVQELKSAKDTTTPTTDAGLLSAYQEMRDVFDALRSTLSCSLCYETFKPNDVVTLECGHTMCLRCLTSWSDANTRLYNLTTTPDCPECRVPGRHYVKVYMLEEVVRTVDRLERMEAQREQQKQAARKAALHIEQAQRNHAGEIQGEHALREEEKEKQEEEEIANLLIERSRHRYAGKPGAQWRPT